MQTIPYYLTDELGLPLTMSEPMAGDRHDLDRELYNQRYTVEHTNTWTDSYRSLLNRFDTATGRWKGSTIWHSGLWPQKVQEKKIVKV